MRNILIVGLMMLVAGCAGNPESEFTTVQVKEVEQVGNYTYLLVKAKGPEFWVAVPSMEATPGETYHYQGGMMMEDFYSRELDRTFDKVLFLEAIYAGTASSEPASVVSEKPGFGNKVPVQKALVEVEAGDGTITVAELFKDAASYEGKTIRIRGEVTKYNPAIMERNWVHLQDGTEFEGKFDLTATSSEAFEVGTVVTLEGTLALNQDFGYGYSYDLLLEQATAVE